MRSETLEAQGSVSRGVRHLGRGGVAGRAGAAAAHRFVAGSGDPQRHRGREPEHTFHEPVPITARIVWEQDGEEHIETVALGWTGRDVYVRMSDTRYQLRAV